jgi:tRNA (cytidine/uridine-2'-O-)-methyltransferase
MHEHPETHVVLVRPEIAWNTGNAGRTCLAVGAQLHLVRPLGFSLASAEVRRAGLDYWPAVNAKLWPDWDAFAAQLPRLGQAFAFSAEGSRSMWDISFPLRTVLIFGCESVGLSTPLRASLADCLVRIPMRPAPVRSLNLSTAVAVAAYEVTRQREAARSGTVPGLGD